MPLFKDYTSGHQPTNPTCCSCNKSLMLGKRKGLVANCDFCGGEAHRNLCIRQIESEIVKSIPHLSNQTGKKICTKCLTPLLTNSPGIHSEDYVNNVFSSIFGSDE